MANDEALTADISIVREDVIHGTGDIDTVACQPWTGWCSSERCKICSTLCALTSFEVAYYHFITQADGKRIRQSERYYISEACVRCTRKLFQRDPELRTQEYWNKKWNLYRQYSEVGLVDCDWMTSLGLKVPVAPSD